MATKTNQVFPALQADDAFVITPSDTLEIKDDPNNTTYTYGFCYVKNSTNAGGSVKVKTVHGTTVTIYINAGAVEPLAVRQVFATSPTPPATLHAYVGHQKV